MKNSRLALLAGTSACLALLLPQPASAQKGPHPKAGNVFAKGLPNLLPAQCRSDNAPGADPICSKFDFEVVVNPLTRGGKTIGCAAFFYYGSLTIVTKKQVGGAEGTQLNWKITDVGTVSGAQAEFIDPAIRLIAEPGPGKPDPNELFETPTWNGVSASVLVKKQALKKSFNHLPVVRYTDNNIGWTECGGVDPTIGNNPS